MWAMSYTKPLSIAVNVGQTFPNLFMVARSERQGGGGEDDLSVWDHAEHPSAARDAVQGRLSRGSQERSYPLVFVVLFWFSAVFFTGVEPSWPPLLWWKQPLISAGRVCASVSLCVFLGAWAFLWFVCFCLLASQWAQTQDIRGIPMDAPRATVAFSFFSIATWVSGTAPVSASRSKSFIEVFRVGHKNSFHSTAQAILTYFALGRFRRGVQEVSVPTYTEPPPDHHTPYPPTYAPASYNPTTYTPTTYTAYPSNVPDMQQQPPYISNPQPQEDSGYKPPSYWVKRRSQTKEGGWGGCPDHLWVNWLELHCTDPELLSHWCGFTLHLKHFVECCHVLPAWAVQLLGHCGYMKCPPIRSYTSGWLLALVIGSHVHRAVRKDATFTSNGLIRKVRSSRRELGMGGKEGGGGVQSKLT